MTVLFVLVLECIRANKFNVCLIMGFLWAVIKKFLGYNVWMSLSIKGKMVEFQRRFICYFNKQKRFGIKFKLARHGIKRMCSEKRLGGDNFSWLKYGHIITNTTRPTQHFTLTHTHIYAIWGREPKPNKKFIITWAGGNMLINWNSSGLLTYK